MPTPEEHAVILLQNKIKKMAARQEAPGNYDKKNRCYKVTLESMQNEDALSFPAYLMLSTWWNDALDWAEKPELYDKRTPEYKKSMHIT